MGIELEWWDDGLTLVYECRGIVTGDDLIVRNREALSDPRFPRIQRQICDLTEVSRFDVTSDQVRRIVDIDFEAAAIATEMKAIALITEADLIRGFGRMYELLLDGRIPTWSVEVHPDRASALEWLGITPPARRG